MACSREEGCRCEDAHFGGRTAVKDTKNPPSLFERAYPDSLRCAEDSVRPCRKIGLALSGGGIRSATFALGVLQALAKCRIEAGKSELANIDVLSTVSGGSYIGGAISRLFARRQVSCPDDVARAILPAPRQLGSSGRIGPGSVLDRLRQNGSYLAPNGGGDLLLGGTVMLRNWLAVHGVLLILPLTLFVLLRSVRESAELEDAVRQFGSLFWFQSDSAGSTCPLECLREPSKTYFARFLSPWIALPFVVLPFSVALAWCYWIVAAFNRHRWQGVSLVVAAIGTGIALLSEFQPVLAALFTAVAVLAALLALAVWCSSKRGQGSAARHRISRWTMRSLVVLGLTLGVAVIDSAGFYLARGDVLSLISWLAGIASAASVALGAMRLMPRLLPLRVRFDVSFNAVALVVGIVLCLLILVGVSYLTHRAWYSVGDLRAFWMTGLALLVLCVLLGRSWTFLNGTSLHSLYSARLTRAYLGASNHERNRANRGSVTETLPGDDFHLKRWWSKTGRCKLQQRGAPLHLVNVTVNENVVANVQRADRKGVGMAIGAAGFSAGVRHHAVFLGTGRAKVYPSCDARFRMFQGWDGRERSKCGEELTFGEWLGISGAAFSTGAGSRTRLGLSLVAGLFNVRLGYWWDSQTARRDQGLKTCVLRYLKWPFEVQTHLLYEFLAHFLGPSRRRWYLSDGGHFENLGAYELFRRRLPLIVVIDAEADPDYRFQGLANLVRKVRTDFHAEVTFLDEEALQRLPIPNCFGTLEMLRRGPWAEEAIPSGYWPNARKRRVFGPASRRAKSLAHAALAHVRYDGEEEPKSVMVYVKPTLTGNEPADVAQYHSANWSFPHETTSDQFFGEAQWESYRKLGEHIGERVLCKGLKAYVDLRARPGHGDQR